MVLREPPLQLQLLSFVDAQVNVVKHYNGFLSGDMVPFSLLDSPLVSFGNAPLDPQPLSANLRNILSMNLNDNPLYRSFKCIFEREGKSTGVAVVSSDVVDKILQENRARGPLSPVDFNLLPNVLGLISDERPLAGSQAPKRNTIFEMGSMFLREKLLTPRSGAPDQELVDHLPFSVASDGLMPDQRALKNFFPSLHLTLETALFPFLFPFGTGAYDGAVTLCNYLRMRMRMFFSVFTLHKLYLLLMYQLRQAVVLSNAFKQS
jgi:hypothetical protein